MKIGVLANPLSRRNRKLLPAIETLLGRYSDVVYVRLDRFDELGRALQRFAEARIEVLIISGGDGTIAASLTQIFEHEVFARRIRSPVMSDYAAGLSTRWSVVCTHLRTRRNPAKSSSAI